MFLSEQLDYYKEHGIMTEPGLLGYILDQYGRELPHICRDIHKVTLIDFFVDMGAVMLPEERRQEVNIRSVSDKLKRILELDNKPVTEDRAVENRLLCNCRDLSLLVCAVLRHYAVPARVRSGFATIFDPEKYYDHWICEYWSELEKRWIRVDPWMDQIRHERDSLPLELKAGLDKLSYDPLDVGEEHFIEGGEAWRRCRQQGCNSDSFGTYGDLKGLWFIRDNMLRDMLCLNKVEVLPWDCWGLMSGVRVDPSEKEELATLDYIAELLKDEEASFSEMRALYEKNQNLHFPGI